RVAEYGFERSLSMRTTDHGPPMPRRSLTRSRVKSTVAPQPAAPAGVVRRREGGRRHWLLVGVGGLAIILGFVLIGQVIPESPGGLRAAAEAAARAGDWTLALQRWRALNAAGAARAATHLGEARACLALGRAAQAERSLRRAIAVDPADPEP